MIKNISLYLLLKIGNGIIPNFIDYFIRSWIKGFASNGIEGLIVKKEGKENQFLIIKILIKLGIS
jgi:hypothetical protein